MCVFPSLTDYSHNPTGNYSVSELEKPHNSTSNLTIPVMPNFCFLFFVLFLNKLYPQ